MLRVVEERRRRSTPRVVVGKPDTQTPVFSHEMEDGRVQSLLERARTPSRSTRSRPTSGRRRRFFGGGRWNTSVLKRHGLRINYGSRDIDPDHDRLEPRRYPQFRPRAAARPDNVLGQVKFVFPNKHDVYMHDTTQKHLFANAVRAESHGCMRVQNPDRWRG